MGVRPDDHIVAFYAVAGAAIILLAAAGFDPAWFLAAFGGILLLSWLLISSWFLPFETVTAFAETEEVRDA